MKNNKINKSDYSSLKNSIKKLLEEGRVKAGRAVNSILVQTYWNVGKYIVEYEQSGNVKSQYGTELLDRLSKELTLEFGKGFSRTNLFQMRQMYVKFPKIQTLSEQLSWSHYCEILKADDEIYILKNVKKEEIEPYKELKINIDAFADFDLQNYLNLGVSKKSNVTVVY